MKRYQHAHRNIVLSTFPVPSERKTKKKVDDRFARLHLPNKEIRQQYIYKQRRKRTLTFWLLTRGSADLCRSRSNCRRVFGRTTTMFPFDVIVVLVLRCSRRKVAEPSKETSSSSSRLIRDKPKSATTTCPSLLTKQFELFKSRWIMLHE